MIDAYDPPAVWAPFGAFSQVVVQGDGQIAHLKGQVALDPQGEVVGAGDMAAQVRRALENVEALLAAFGGRMADVYALTHYVTDIPSFMGAGEVRKAFFAAPYPVTTTVEVAALFDPRLLVEITASAEIPRDRFRPPRPPGPGTPP